MHVARSTFARIVILSTALGYKIVVNEIERYSTKLTLLATLYSMALTISLLVDYLKSEY